MMENNDNKNNILNVINSKTINQDMVYEANEIIILDDDDFIQTTFNLFSRNELNQEDDQFNTTCSNEELLKQPSDIIDLTINDDFDLYDMFMVNSGSNYNLNDNKNLKHEISLMVKTELESKTMNNLIEIPEIILIEDEVSSSDNYNSTCNFTENSKSKIFTCLECSKSFNKSYNHKRHVSLHKIKNGETSSCHLKKNSCPNCRKEITDRSNFIKHLKICSPESIEKFQTKKKNKLDNKKEYECLVCGKIFNKKYNLTRHLGMHFLNELNRGGKCPINLDDRSLDLQVKINLYECESCNRKFSTKQLLLDHKTKWHGTNYECKFCQGVSFNEKIEFIRHLNLDHKLRFKFECKFCKDTFRYISQYIQHNLTHLNNFEDNYLEKFNKTSDTNSTDCSKSNFNKELKNIQCLFCGKKFSKKYNLKRHLEKKHSIANDDNQNQINQLFSMRQNQFFEQNKAYIMINKI